MHLNVIRAFLGKDTKAFLRDRFFVVITLVGLAFYIGIYHVLPDTVDEVVELGISGDFVQSIDPAMLGSGEGFALVAFDSAEALQQAIEDGGSVVAGLAFPDGFLGSVMDGEEVTVTVITGQGMPPELRGALTSMVREVAFALAGEELPVTQLVPSEMVLGIDRVGDQLSVQERMRPFFAFLVLMVEAIALGSLIAEELQQKTVRAVLVTPASIRDFLASKAIFGTLLAFFEALILLVALRALAVEPVLILFVTLLGAALVTGFALIAGSLGKDFITVLFWSMLFMIPLIIPAGALLFPGTAAPWIRFLPSYPLARVIVDVTSYGAGWTDLTGSLALLGGWVVVALGAGGVILRRRVVAP